MSMSWIEVEQQAGIFLDSFNILGMGLVGIFIVAMIFLASYMSERKDEKLLAMLLLLGFGGLMFWASDPSNYLILIVVVLIIVFGFFRKLWTKNKEGGMFE
jgi:hypothetical protein